MRKKTFLREVVSVLVLVLTISLFAGCGGPTVEDTFKELFGTEDSKETDAIDKNEKDSADDNVVSPDNKDNEQQNGENKTDKEPTRTPEPTATPEPTPTLAPVEKEQLTTEEATKILRAAADTLSTNTKYELSMNIGISVDAGEFGKVTLSMKNNMKRDGNVGYESQTQTQTDLTGSEPVKNTEEIITYKNNDGRYSTEYYSVDGGKTWTVISAISEDMNDDNADFVDMLKGATVIGVEELDNEYVFTCDMGVNTLDDLLADIGLNNDTALAKTTVTVDKEDNKVVAFEYLISCTEASVEDGITYKLDAFVVKYRVDESISIVIPDDIIKNAKEQEYGIDEPIYDEDDDWSTENELILELTSYNISKLDAKNYSTSVERYMSSEDWENFISISDTITHYGNVTEVESSITTDINGTYESIEYTVYEEETAEGFKTYLVNSEYKVDDYTVSDQPVYGNSDFSSFDVLADLTDCYVVQNKGDYTSNYILCGNLSKEHAKRLAEHFYYCTTDKVHGYARAIFSDKKELMQLELNINYGDMIVDGVEFTSNSVTVTLSLAGVEPVRVPAFVKCSTGELTGNFPEWLEYEAWDTSGYLMWQLDCYDMYITLRGNDAWYFDNSWDYWCDLMIAGDDPYGPHFSVRYAQALETVDNADYTSAAKYVLPYDVDEAEVKNVGTFTCNGRTGLIYVNNSKEYGTEIRVLQDIGMVEYLKISIKTEKIKELSIEGAIKIIEQFLLNM